MHHYVVDKEVSDVDARRECGYYEINSESNDVRWIQTTEATLPKCAKFDLMILAGGPSLSPLQVNAESRDDEEKKYTDVAKRAEELNQANGVLKEVGRNGARGLPDRVIEDNAQGRDTTQGIDAQQAIRRGNKIRPGVYLREVALVQVLEVSTLGLN